jgi:hypothetical protein
VLRTDRWYEREEYRPLAFPPVTTVNMTFAVSISSKTNMPSHSPRTCNMCESGFFKTTPGPENCSPVTPECQLNSTYEAEGPTATTDRRCLLQTPCNTMHFEIAAPTPTSDRVCAPCKTCPEDHAEVAACSAVTDTVCQGCEICVRGMTFADNVCPLSDVNPCRPCTVCSSEEYESVSCLPMQDAVCQLLTQCTGDEYETDAATATSDRACKALTKCNENEYVAQPATATSDR